ncbi:MAG: hypothetical protein PW786_15110 [Arachidicoccus sp.]|nr:hypothetical protein [Arachidicoccus sp.]
MKEKELFNIEQPSEIRAFSALCPKLELFRITFLQDIEGLASIAMNKLYLQVFFVLINQPT